MVHRPTPVLNFWAPADRKHRVDPSGSCSERHLSGLGIFLIHGYKTPSEDVEEAYASFERHLTEVAAGRLDGSIVRVLWPGRAHDRMLPAAYFKWSNERAKETAEAFAGWLGRWGPFRQVVLVAHSLGCRVAVETARRLAGSVGAATEVRLVLMAAAIPVDDDHGDLAHAKARVVLHSGSDSVLRWIFPWGQLKIDGRWTEAVGLHGQPADAWTGHVPMTQGFRHHHYWSSRRAASTLAGVMGVPQPRSLPAVVETARAEPPARALPTFDAAERRIGAMSGRP